MEEQRQNGCHTHLRFLATSLLALLVLALNIVNVNGGDV